MARTQLAVQSITKSGITPSYSAATVDGFAFDNSSGKVFLHVKNTSGSACTVTVDVPVTVEGLVVADLTFSVPATTGDKMIGPFSPSVYSQDSTTPDLDEAVLVNFSVQSGVSVAALKLA
jgi:hypothetical protein